MEITLKEIENQKDNCAFFIFDKGTIFMVTSEFPTSPVIHGFTRDNKIISYCLRNFLILEIKHDKYENIATFYYHNDFMWSFEITSKHHAILSLQKTFPEVFYLRGSELNSFIVSKKLDLIENLQKQQNRIMLFDFTGEFEILDGALPAKYIARNFMFMNAICQYCKESNIPTVSIGKQSSRLHVSFTVGQRTISDRFFTGRSDVIRNVMSVVREFYLKTVNI